MSLTPLRLATRALTPIAILLAAIAPASRAGSPGLSAPAGAASSPVTGAWTGDFSVPAFDGATVACAVFNGTYVVGGSFQWAAGVPAHNVAMWTGSAWTQAGEGLSGPVTCLEPNGAELLAGTNNFNTGVSPVLSFDGLSWRPLGANLYGAVNALLVSGANLYAAGQFLLPDQSNGPRVIVWDGSAWHSVGGIFDGDLHALAIFHGDLYVAGEFLSAEGTPASRIARFDGTHWQDVGGGTGAGGGVQISALAVFGDRLYAGGAFSSIGGVDANGVGAWDGTSWHELPNTPDDVFVRDLQVEGTLLHVAGVLQVRNQWASGLATFDGTSWTTPSPRPSWGVEDVAVGAGSLIAVGDMSGLERPNAGLDEPARNVVVRDTHWHGLAPWQPEMRGLMGDFGTQVNALQLYQGEVYAGGYFQRSAKPPQWISTPNIARWDGDQWQPLASTLTGNVNRMTVWGSRLVVGGTSLWADVSPPSSVLAWDGTAWAPIADPLQGYVDGLTVWNDALVVSRQLGSQEQPEPPLAISRGAGWEYMGRELLANRGSVADVAVFGGQLVVLGTKLTVPGSPPQGVAAWDGSSWRALPGALAMPFSCALSRGDGLWLGGSTSFPSSAPSAVWRWTGATLTPVGGLDGSVSRLAETPAGVYAAGSLNVRGQPTTLARFNDGEWRVVPASPDRPANALAALGNQLFVGGSFKRAGDRQAEGIALWIDESPAPTGALLALPWPTPSRDQATFRFTLPAGGRARLRIYDLHGALVAEPLDESFSPGTYERAWSFAASPQRVHAGIYFARLVTDRGTAHARIVIAP